MPFGSLLIAAALAASTPHHKDVVVFRHVETSSGEFTPAGTPAEPGAPYGPDFDKCKNGCYDRNPNSINHPKSCVLMSAGHSRDEKGVLHCTCGWDCTGLAYKNVMF